MYELLLAVHILAAVIWVGGSVALAILGARVSPADRGALAPHMNWYGSRVITGAAVVLLIAGFGLVGELQHVRIGDLWVVLALIGYAISFVFGAAILGPTGAKMERAMADGDAAGAEAAYKRIMTVSRIDTLIVLLVVVDMAVKPGA